MKRVGALFLAVTLTAAADQTGPSALLVQIKERGAKAVFEGLDPSAWGQILAGVESGKRQWLEVAVAIYPATDAGPSVMLIQSGGVALVRAPKDVLTILVPTHPIQGICGYPEMGDERTDTKEEVLAYLRARSQQVETLKGKDIQAKRSECLKVLAATERDVLRPDGPFGK